MKRGDTKAVFFSTDALIAIIIIFLTLLISFPLIKYAQHETTVPNDILTTFSSLSVGEINNSYVKNLIAQGKIRDLNKTLLEQIGEFYVTNITLARELGTTLMTELTTQDNIGIWYGNKLITSKNKTSFEAAKNIEINRQTISGIQEGDSVTGFSARAFLSRATPKKYFFFGGYVGDGNITSKVVYNGDIRSAELELVINKNFDLYVNDIYSGSYGNSSSEFTPATFDINAYVQNFNSGENTIKFVGDNLHITGGFIKIVYENISTPESYIRHYFPGIEGLINVYDGLYIPGDLNELKMYLHFKSNYTTLVTIGNVTVFNGTSSGNPITLDNPQLVSLINYTMIERKTIPLRIGLQSIINQSGGNADVIIITDLSGSMDWELDQDNSDGVARACNDSAINSSTTKRISLAKCLDKQVVDIILNVTGNKVGLSGFYADDTPPFKGRVYEQNLTENRTLLYQKLNAYTVKGGTCICCAINDAYKILNEQSNSSRKRFVIVMSDGIPTHTCQAASGCQGTRTGLSGNEGLWLGYGAGCYGGSDDCDVNDCSCASQNTNWSSCRLHDDLNAKTYAIGLGPVLQCTIANNTLQQVAQCGKGLYFASTNATLLTQFYQTIAHEIVSLSYKEQSAVGTSLNTILYDDSYMEFNYTKDVIPYGLLITTEKNFDNASAGTFSIPANSSIQEARIVSYSGPRWTNTVEINDTVIFRLSGYGDNYLFLGDPYVIQIPLALIGKNNTIRLTTGLSPTNTTVGSASNKIIYTIAKNFTSYSSISSFAEGCLWTIDFEDNTQATLRLPLLYSGTNVCSYIQGNIDYDSNDALQTAVYHLLRSLDFDGNEKIESKFITQDFQISSTAVTGIPFGWSTEVQVRRWT